MSKKENPMKVRIGYNKKEDMYQLLLSTDGGETWDFSFGSVCQRSANDDEDAEPMFISCQLVEELKKAIRCGFEVVY